MSSTRWAAGLIGAAIAGGALWAVTGGASAQTGASGTIRDAGGVTYKGNFIVELIIDPTSGANTDRFAAPIKDVDEITLLSEWAVLRRKEGIKSATLVVPRERVVYINFVD